MNCSNVNASSLASAEAGEWGQGETSLIPDPPDPMLAVAGGPPMGGWGQFNMSSTGSGSGTSGLRAAASEVSIAGQPWRAFQPGDAAIQNGCEAVAESIKNAIGGEIRTIQPSIGNYLGGVRNAVGNFVNPAGSKAAGWSSHTVVVKGGRVYDALTGPQGMPVAEYKALWEYGDALLFGF